MLFVPPTMASVYQTNLSVSSQNGTTITSSASANTKGSYTSLVDPTDFPSYGIWIRIGDVGASAAVTDMLVDIAFGPTGGGNEEIIIPNLNVSGAGTLITYPHKVFFFPVYVPTGTRVSARCQDTAGSDTCVIAIWLGQDALLSPMRGKVTDYGAVIASSRGTLVTPGNATYGTWTQLDASLDYAHRLWSIATDSGGDTSLPSNGRSWLIELGVGPDSGNVTAIGGPFALRMTTQEMIPAPFPLIQYGETVAGDPLWVRAASEGLGVEARGVIAYGMD